MSLEQELNRDERVTDAILTAILARSHAPLSQRGAEARVAALTSEDEAMLNELERSDGTFIDLLVDEVWDDAGPLPGLALSDDQGRDYDRPTAEMVSHVS